MESKAAKKANVVSPPKMAKTEVVDKAVSLIS